MQSYIPVSSPRHIAALFMCQMCGNAVVNREQHNLWHDRLDKMKTTCDTINASTQQ